MVVGLLEWTTCDLWDSELWVYIQTVGIYVDLRIAQYRKKMSSLVSDLVGIVVLKFAVCVTKLVAYLF